MNRSTRLLIISRFLPGRRHRGLDATAALIAQSPGRTGKPAIAYPGAMPRDGT
jgi:hypothetical protein